MKHCHKQWLKLSTLALGIMPFLWTPVQANETLSTTVRSLSPANQNIIPVSSPNNAFASNLAENPLAQLTNVFQLQDLSPTDWSYGSLRSLVERYGCIAGYPDSTYQGNRALTRYEFAAGLNACLHRVNELIARGTADLVRQEDLIALQRLQEEFAAELATLQGRVDALEIRTSTLEAQQFSTTTKLQGESSFSLTSAFGGEKAGGGDLDEIPVWQQRTRLILNTSLTGKDLLKIFLVSGNSTPFAPRITGTNMTQLNFPLDTNSSVVLGKMFYRFSPSDNFRVHIDAVGAGYNANIPTFNELFTPETGAISYFGRFNPIYYQGLGGSGATLIYDFNKALSLSVGYVARGTNNPANGQGLFNGDYAALAQLTVKPTNDFRFGLTYVRSFYPGNEVLVSGGTGSQPANQPFGQAIPTSADHAGLEFNYRITPSLIFSGWVGLSFAHAEGGGFNPQANSLVQSENQATIYNWALTLAFLDIGTKGSLLGLTIGQPPKVSFNNGGAEDPDSAWHLEGQYRYPIHDNVALNPGFFVVINPENNRANRAIWVGTVRVLFRF